jgi:hypothetical protein
VGADARRGGRGGAPSSRGSPGSRCRRARGGAAAAVAEPMVSTWLQAPPRERAFVIEFGDAP